MFCKFCGNNLDDDAKFCTKCGKLVGDSSEKYNEPNERYSAETEAVRNDLAGSILKFGIMGLAFGVCSFFLSFLGIIFSAIAKSKAKEYELAYGSTTGKATVGKNLATGGLIASIIFTAIVAFYFTLMITFIGVYGGI